MRRSNKIENMGEGKKNERHWCIMTLRFFFFFFFFCVGGGFEAGVVSLFGQDIILLFTQQGFSPLHS